MGENTKIEWAHPPGYKGDTWNPVRGCSRVSAGCENCYAEDVAHRYGGPGMPYEGLTVVGNNGPRWNGEVRFVEKKLLDPFRRQKPTCYFVNSMSDLFHEKLPFETIDKIFAVMALSPQHIFQVLTKRPQRMKEYMLGLEGRVAEIIADFYVEDPKRAKTKPLTKELAMHAVLPFSNVWLGVSVEDQETADDRIPLLLETPAALRWISAEPLLGPLNLRYFLSNFFRSVGDKHIYTLDWVVTGGESGPGARPLHPDWIEDIRDDCRGTRTPFFHKQHGEFMPLYEIPDDVRICVSCGCTDHTPCQDEDGPCYWLDTVEDRCSVCKGKVERLYRFDDGTPVLKVGKATAGHLIDGLEYQQYPEVRHAS